MLLLTGICVLYWCSAILLYIIKWIYPCTYANTLLLYGKLRDDNNESVKSNEDGWIGLVTNGMVFPVCTTRIFFVSMYAFALALFFILGCFVVLFKNEIFGFELDLQLVVPQFGLMFVQLLRRFCECIFLHKFSYKRVTTFHVLCGFSYYFVVVLGLYTDLTEIAIRALDDKHNVLALALFLFGSSFQSWCHFVLAHTKPAKGQAKYGVPDLFPFQHIAAPHYLSEILIYVALFVVGSGRRLCVAFNLLFVIVNLTDSACNTWRWYRTAFQPPLSNPPRFAILPFIL